MDNFREFVLAWLERRGWSQARLAEAAEINQSLVSKHLTEDPRRRVKPSPENLARYAPVLGVSYEDLMRMCGFLPGKAELAETSDIDADVTARTAELLAAVKGAPPAFWETMIRSTFDVATDYARNMASMLQASESERSTPIDAGPRQDTDQRGGSRSGKSRRRPNIKLRHAEFALAG